MIKFRKVDNSEIAVITAIAGYHPMQHLKALSAELNSIDYCGVVVFDLLVFNGQSDNRFATLFFNGKSFDRASFKTPTDIDQNLINKQDNYFRTHPDLLKKSVLSFSELKNF
ncbi:type II toxin-antitoxin system RnlB family antitoxin [Endozoicomonas sp. ALC066]|uniref:type II toxin-antitoxin system RnlB family antitoxin n=1 Tax=Endozoicomonas sp. ALC066 TaxID=3403078 RepID=UPI003BB8042C